VSSNKDGFDPNKHLDLWATYIYSRTPKFKVHYRVSHATAAIKAASDRDLNGPWDSHIIPKSHKFYHLTDGKWVEVELREGYNRDNTSIFKEC
jgi:hypothetical protein